MYERVLKDNKDYLHPFSTYIIGSLFILVLFLAGCGSSDYRPEAIGKEGEILVVIDSARWNGEVGEILREELGQYIGTLPQPEREFILRPASIDAQLNNIKQFKNVVIVAPLSDSSNVALFLRSRLGEEGENMLNRIGGMVVPKQNLWRRNQMVVYVTAPTAEDLVNIIDQKGEDLRYLFNEKTRERLTRDMFEKGRQFEIGEKLMERHDFAVNAQHDYYIAIDTLAKTVRVLHRKRQPRRAFGGMDLHDPGFTHKEVHPRHARRLRRDRPADAPRNRKHQLPRPVRLRVARIVADDG